MDREAWHAAVHGTSKNRTRLSDWTEVIPQYKIKSLKFEGKKKKMSLSCAAFSGLSIPPPGGNVLMWSLWLLGLDLGSCPLQEPCGFDWVTQVLWALASSCEKWEWKSPHLRAAVRIPTMMIPDFGTNRYAKCYVFPSPSDLNVLILPSLSVTQLCTHSNQCIIFWYFPGGPVLRTPCFHCMGHGFHPWLEN